MSELVKVKKCKSWRKGGWGGADRDVGRQPQQRDLVLLIRQGQTEGRAVSSLLISSDRLTPQHPLGCPILCIYCCSCRAAKSGAGLIDGQNCSEEPTTVCQRIYMPINAVRSLACYRSLKLNKITLKKGVKYRFWIGGSRCFCSQSFFFCLFFFHSFLPRLLPPPHFLSSADFPLSLLSPAVVVMPTSQETVLSWIPSGRADQLMSGVIQACAQIGLLYVRSFPPYFAVSSRSPHTSQPNTN